MRSTSEGSAVAEASRYLHTALASHPQPRVLDAGCGRRAQLDLNGAFVVGLDIAPTEIALNGSLGETVVGDLQTYPLAPASFDAAVCLNVLEHLEQPVAALDNMRHALRPGGVLLLSVPNLRSLKTCSVRATPPWLHRRVWRHLYPDAPPDHGPFPAVHDSTIDLDELAHYADHHGMALTSIAYESEMQARIRAKLRLTGSRWNAVACAVDVATLGYLDAWHSDALLILQRP